MERTETENDPRREQRRDKPSGTIPSIPLVRFLYAFFRRETYAFLRNRYTLAGFLWGIPVPVATLGIHLYAVSLPPAWDNILLCIRTQPLHLLFLLHPFLFAMVFGAFGTMVHDRDRRISELLLHFQSLAIHDGLTGLLNHRTFQERIREEAARAGREGDPVSLLIVDIDHFKRFNDRYGHPVGDEVLKRLARLFEANVREYDEVFRYGGEEFAILLPGLPAREAHETAERIRSRTEEVLFSIEGVKDAQVTLSVGAAALRPNEGVTEWIERADNCLYRAKEEGRNRVFCDTDG